MKLSKLLSAYETHPLSGFRKLRYASRQNHRNLLRQIDRRYGHKKLKNIRARHIIEWHAEWLDGTKFSAAHAFIKRLRTILGFGLTVLENKECRRLRLVMSTLRFPGAPKRKHRITAAQATTLRRAAHRARLPSIALAQAFQFDLMLRQKDVIGEWVPIDEPGESDLIEGNQKWIIGLRWEAIDQDLILRHKTSKRGKWIERDLKLCPMIMEELSRTQTRQSGPVIVCEGRNLPFYAYDFRRKWRQLARICKIPDHVYNMDSRSGGITEAFEAKANPDFIRATATHGELATTMGYNRGDDLATSSQVMIQRVSVRPPPDPA